MSRFDRPSKDVETSSIQRRSVQGGLLTFVSQSVRSLVKLAGQIVIARFLVPADYGLIALMAPFLSLVQLVSDFGFGQAVIQRPDMRQEDVSNLFWLGLALNVTLAGILVLTAPFLVWLYGDQRLLLVAIALAALIPASGLSTLPMALLIRNMRFFELAVLDIVPPTIGLISGLAAAWSGLNYWSLIAGTFGESLTIVTLAWMLSSWRPVRPIWRKSIWVLVRFGGHITGFNIAQYLTTTMDNILLSLTWGEVALGLYDKGYKLVTQPITQILSPVNRIAVPLLVRLAPDVDRYRKTYLGILRSLLLLNVPGIIFLLVLSKRLVILLLGPKWVDVAPVVSWLCVGGLASPVYTSTYWIFVSQERVAQQLRYAMVTSIVTILSFLAGLPWGPTGVAASAGLSFVFLATPILCWGATKCGPIKFLDIGQTILPIILAGLPTALILFTVSRNPVISDLILLPLGLIFSYASFLTSLFLFPSGRRIVRNTWDLRSLFK